MSERLVRDTASQMDVTSLRMRNCTFVSGSQVRIARSILCWEAIIQAGRPVAGVTRSLPRNWTSGFRMSRERCSKNVYIGYAGGRALAAAGLHRRDESG